MTWKMIEGYRCPYRISDQGEVQRQTKDGRWVRVSAHLSRNRAYLTLRKADGIPQKVAVVRLMDTYFFGGRAKRDNMHLMHKNGAKMDCAVENLVITTKKEIGKHWGGTGSGMRRWSVSSSLRHIWNLIPRKTSAKRLRRGKAA